MKITIENTSKLITVNGVPCRVWEGQTESGIRVTCLITRIAAHKDDNLKQFEIELQECRPPSVEMDGAFPLRMIL